MPPSAVALLLLLLSVATAAAATPADGSCSLPTDLTELVVSFVDDLHDLLELSHVSKSWAEATRPARSVGRLLRAAASADDLVTLAIDLCLNPNPHLRRVLRQHPVPIESAIDLVDRMVASTAPPERVAHALSLLLARCDPDVFGDAISGCVMPPANSEDDNDLGKFLRICRIRCLVRGLDFRTRAPVTLPAAVLAQITIYNANPNQDRVLYYGGDDFDAVGAQYPGPFTDLFPEQADLAQYLLEIPELRGHLMSPDVVRELFRFGVRFELGTFLKKMLPSISGPVLARLYPWLGRPPGMDWSGILLELVHSGNFGIVDVLFRTADFERRDALSETALLKLAMAAVHLKRPEMFAVLARHPLMARVCNSIIDGTTLLHAAIQHNRVRIVAILFSFPDLKFTVLDAKGHTPMHYAGIRRPHLRLKLLREMSTREIAFGVETESSGWVNRFLKDLLW